MQEEAGFHRQAWCQMPVIVSGHQKPGHYSQYNGLGSRITVQGFISCHKARNGLSKMVFACQDPIDNILETSHMARYFWFKVAVSPRKAFKRSTISIATLKNYITESGKIVREAGITQTGAICSAGAWRYQRARTRPCCRASLPSVIGHGPLIPVTLRIR
ncbi:hypothetical protein ACLK1Z_24165 [Escherichia coli]